MNERYYKPLVVALATFMAVSVIAVWSIIYEAAFRGGCISFAGAGCGVSDSIISFYYAFCALPLIFCLVATVVATNKLRGGRIAKKNRKLIIIGVIAMLFVVAYPAPTRLAILAHRSSVIRGTTATIVYPDGYECKIVGEFDVGTTCTKRSSIPHDNVVKSRLYSKYFIDVAMDYNYSSQFSYRNKAPIYVTIGRYFPSGTLATDETDTYANQNDVWTCDRSACQHTEQRLSAIDSVFNLTVELKGDTILIK